MTESTDWKVLPHEPIRKLADNLWWVRGTLPGMSLKRTMTVVRLSDGKLLIHSAIAMEPAAQAELEKLGEPSYLIVPNPGHRLDAAAYKRRYPRLRTFAPRGARAKVERIVPVDATSDEFPENDSVRFDALHGIAETEDAMIVSSPDGTSVVLCDSMFNMDRKKDPLGFFFTTILGSAPGPRVSRLAKLVYIKDKAALRADFLRLAELPGLVRVIVAHEKIASGPEARAALIQASGYL
jgi:hypothetical protein